jgi:UPF0755 protein
MSKLFLFIFIVLFFACLLVFVFRFQIYSPADISAKDKIFTIKQGSGVLQIAQALEEQGLIRNKHIFGLYILFRGELGNLKAGQYRLSGAMSAEEITDIFVQGKIEQMKITIIEGWNLIDIAQYFITNNIIKDENDFYDIVGYPRIDYNLNPEKSRPREFNDYDFLEEKPDNVSLEGYLFPDTYYIRTEATLEEIISAFLSNLNKKLSSEIREEIKRQNKTIFEVLIMASLIEKEVRTQEDMETVSGILWKRLAIGMPLQADATVTYITGKRTVKIPLKDLQIDSSYSTYKYSGLPIGPICNPGMASILAALNPKKSPYFYYLSTPEGETLYSATLQEHNIKKAKYLR